MSDLHNKEIFSDGGTRSTICRTCLSTEDEMIPILESVGLKLNLREKLLQYLHVNVLDQDKFPMTMCGRCVTKLINFDELYQLTHHAESILAQKLGILDEVSDSKGYGQDDQLIESVNVKEESDYESENIVTEGQDADEMDEEHGKDDNEMDECADESLLSVESIENDQTEDNESEMEPPRKRRESSRTAAKKRSRPSGKSTMATSKERASEDKLIRDMVSLQCNDCSETADTFDDLMMHYKVEHNKQGEVNCCEKTFKRRFNLLEHVRVHKNPNVFACHICHRPFNSKYYLTDHMAIHIPEDQRQFQCDVCQKRYPTKQRLANHAKSHNPELNFKCTQCDKAFNQKIILYSHMRYVHGKSRTQICEVCAKVFKTKEAFLTHQINHMEVKPPKLTCEICGGKYKNRDSLNQHLLRHKRSGERHECDLCGRIFNCKKRMQAHKKYVHTVEKLKCTFCPKEFKRPICLKEHMASHTGQLLYTCAYCPKQFNSNANKYSHQKAQHPVEWEEARKKRVE